MDPLKRNAPKGAQRRLPNIGEVLRELGHQIAVHAVHLGMVGLAHHSHKIPGGYVGHARANAYHAPNRRVTHRHGLSQLVKRSVHSGKQPVSGKLLHDFFHLVGPLKRFGDKILPAERSQRALRPGRNN